MDGKLLVMIGVPGSGKSTWAKEIAKQRGAELLSSDSIYVEITGDEAHSEPNGKDVFEELYRRAGEILKAGGEAIIDSTNTSPKRRMALMQRFPKAFKECFYAATPFEVCAQRDEKREKRVGPSVVRQMHLNLQIPTYAEGWDKIHILHHEENAPWTEKREFFEELIQGEATHGQLFGALSEIKAFSDIRDLPQDSSYHAFSVSRHTYWVWDHIRNSRAGADRLAMLWTGLLHDTGKRMAKTFKDGKRYASFAMHENVSAQNAAHILHNLGYGEAFVRKVSELCLWHMRLLKNGESAKADEKLRRFVGEETYEQLAFFREADTSGK